MSSWVTIVFTTLGGGAVGSVITTYGTQTKERRAARVQARESLLRAQRAVPGRTALDQQSQRNLRKWEREILRTPKAPASGEPDYKTIRQALREDR